MNKGLFESNWKLIRSQTPGWWSLMTDEEMSKVDKADSKFDRYVTMLQVKYGYTREQAIKEVGKRLEVYESAEKNESQGLEEKVPAKDSLGG